ncbi:hypothetical protein DL764_003319 [Monosporascus ibericus]|uniref:Ketopantoate reductase C-terminal domain-containing protein n=1 Tax=Monosporascus ibericus TaxID=155417 RepID=A0A4Q4TKY6_9PEZI|nr:hypothetical protein DL764_003319 [Monosporascus ibericus]
MPSTAELIRPAVSGYTTIIDTECTVVYLPVTQISPAVVHHREVELLHVGTYPAEATPKPKEAAQAFTELVRSSGGSVKLHDGIQFERWTKLLVNGSWDPICALTRLRDRQFIDGHVDALHFIRDVMLEICAVAQACGYEGVDDGLVDYQIGRAFVREPPGVQPPMMADALAERSLEVEAIIGNLVRLAQAKAARGVLYITQNQIREKQEDGQSPLVGLGSCRGDTFRVSHRLVADDQNHIDPITNKIRYS